MALLLNIINQVRLIQNNDWVIMLIIGCAFLYIFMMKYLQRDASLQEFLVQEFSVSANGFLSWLMTSLVFCLSISVLISQYVPIVPKIIVEISPFGYHLNKFGFTFLVILLFYLAKSICTYFFYQSVGASRKWAVFYFAATKYYFIWSLLILLICILHYYYPIDKNIFFVGYLSFFLLSHLSKLLYYLFHKSRILPNEWYYKFLYICTLQIAPLFALWKLLFF